MAYHLQGSGRGGVGDLQRVSGHSPISGTERRDWAIWSGEEFEHIGTWPVVYSLRRSEWQRIEVRRTESTHCMQRVLCG